MLVLGRKNTAFYATMMRFYLSIWSGKGRKQHNNC